MLSKVYMTLVLSQIKWAKLSIQNSYTLDVTSQSTLEMDVNTDSSRSV